jgi:hypothetical protein
MDQSGDVQKRKYKLLCIFQMDGQVGSASNASDLYSGAQFESWPGHELS